MEVADTWCIIQTRVDSQSMSENPIRCLGFCLVRDGDGKVIGKGFLSKSPTEGSEKLFCTTKGCTFAYRDESNRDHWMGEVIQLNLPTEEPFQ